MPRTRSGQQANNRGAYAPLAAPLVTGLGDSIIGGAPVAVGSSVSGNPSIYGESIFTHAVYASMGQVRMLRNAGVGGETSTQVVSRLAAELAYRPSRLLVSMGRNDPGASISLATTQANFATLVSTARAAGVGVDILGIPPAGTNASLAKINAWLRRWVLTQPGVGFIDTESLLISASSADFGTNLGIGDSTHPSAQGMLLVGQAVAAMWARTLPTHGGFLETYNNSPQNLLTNGCFITDGGGGVPTGWTTLGTSASFTTSLPASAIGKGNAAQMVIADAGTFRQYNFNLFGGGSAASAVGHTLGFGVIASCTAGMKLDMYPVLTGATPNTPALAVVNTGSVGLTAITQALFYAEYVIPAGVTAISFRLRADNAGTVTWQQATVVDLTALNL